MQVAQHQGVAVGLEQRTGVCRLERSRAYLTEYRMTVISPSTVD